MKREEIIESLRFALNIAEDFDGLDPSTQELLGQVAVFLDRELLRPEVLALETEDATNDRLERLERGLQILFRVLDAGDPMLLRAVRADLVKLGFLEARPADGENP